MRRVFEMELPGEGVLVDLGCGAGALLATIAGTYSLRMGMDNRDRRSVNTRITSAAPWVFVAADLDSEFPLADGCADAVIANQVVEHLRDPRPFASEIRRILRHGGVAIVTTPNIRYLKNLFPIIFRGIGPRTAGYEMDGLWDGGHIHYFTHGDLRDVFVNAGFDGVATRGLVNRETDSVARKVLDRFSAQGIVREFLTGNIQLIARR